MKDMAFTTTIKKELFTKAHSCKTNVTEKEEKPGTMEDMFTQVNFKRVRKLEREYLNSMMDGMRVSSLMGICMGKVDITSTTVEESLRANSDKILKLASVP